MGKHDVVNEAEWELARRELLAKEKQYDLKGLAECFAFIETQMSCYYRAPNIPDYACAFVAGECVAVSSAAQPTS